jgi:hypothetical protein
MNGFVFFLFKGAYLFHYRPLYFSHFFSFFPLFTTSINFALARQTCRLNLTIIRTQTIIAAIQQQTCTYPQPTSHIHTKMLSVSSNNANGSSSTAKVLTGSNMNPRVRKAEYAVRGELAIRSEKIKVVSNFYSIPHLQLYANCAWSPSHYPICTGTTTFLLHSKLMYGTHELT